MLNFPAIGLIIYHSHRRFKHQLFVQVLDRFCHLMCLIDFICLCLFSYVYLPAHSQLYLVLSLSLLLSRYILFNSAINSLLFRRYLFFFLEFFFNFKCIFVLSFVKLFSKIDFILLKCSTRYIFINTFIVFDIISFTCK